MDRQEIVALCTLFLIVIGFPAGVFAYQCGLRQSDGYLPATEHNVADWDSPTSLDLVAQAPEAGGWKPKVITVNKGDAVRLRITGLDVVHGFAIGRMGIDAGMIYPGETATVEFVAEEVGRFTYYCNVWCSPFHYRMRGTLEVVDPNDPAALLISEVEEPDTSVVGEVDIDSPHEAEFYPVVRPSAARGKVLYSRLFGPGLPSWEQLEAWRGQSPSAVFRAIVEGDFPFGALRSEESLTSEETWDLVAYIWSLTTTTQKVAMGQALYAKNCAACHGEVGSGDGPGARYLGKPPTDFTHVESMAGGTSRIYLAKIRRGGMGTGMPYWGPIFGQEELRSIVDYLWTFLFSYGND